jgi:ATP-dependent Clp protease adaptor protein ClpS
MSNVDIAEDIKLDETIKQKSNEPLKYKVVFLNDDATPIDWVVRVLVDIFKHSAETAEKITLTIHTEGSGVAGIYTYEIAEQKTIEATNASRNHGFPLQIKMEQE